MTNELAEEIPTTHLVASISRQAKCNSVLGLASPGSLAEMPLPTELQGKL